MNRIVPCLWFDHQAEAAAQFYTELFPGGKITAVSRYPDSFDTPVGKPRGSVLTVEFNLGGQNFTALNGGPQFTLNPSISFFVEVPQVAQAVNYFNRLAEGGATLMALGEYPWSPQYGWVQDRYGMTWQIMARPEAAALSFYPCLLFSGAQHGQAERALQTYARIFPRGEVVALERYLPDEGPVGTLKYGRAQLDGQGLAAMDSHLAEGTPFNEALSLQVMCANQEEVDYYWDRLTASGGKPGPCGWLHDPFGVSWQVVPRQIVAWMTHPDPAARERAFGAMMQMSKLDIATLDAALRG